MPITCITQDAPTLVLYRFEGAWDGHELIERRRELVTAGQLTAKSAVLFDLRRSTGMPSLGDLHPALTDGIWPVCRAFVITTEEQHNLARQLQTLLGPHTVINAIFQDEARAMEWLSVIAGRTHATR